MKENSEFKPVKLRLKIDLVSYPARAEGLGKYDMIIYICYLMIYIVDYSLYKSGDYGVVLYGYFGLVWFHGISKSSVILFQILFYTFIKYMIFKHFEDEIFK